METLTASQVAGIIGVSVYTLRRWYDWFEQEDTSKLEELFKKGMPKLPEYKTMGPTKWRYWEASDIEVLKKFKEFIPHTRGGFMGSLNKKGE